MTSHGDRDLMWLDRGAIEHWHRGDVMSGRIILDEDEVTAADGMACYSGPCAERIERGEALLDDPEVDAIARIEGVSPQLAAEWLARDLVRVVPGRLPSLQWRTTTDEVTRERLSRARVYARNLRESLVVTRGMRHSAPGGLASWVRAESASVGYRMNDQWRADRDSSWRLQAAACAAAPRECACE